MTKTKKFLCRGLKFTQPEEIAEVEQWEAEIKISNRDGLYWTKPSIYLAGLRYVGEIIRKAKELKK